MELTINEFILSNMEDELERASSLLDWLSNEYPQIYQEIQDGELGDELKQDIEGDLERIRDIYLGDDFKVVETTTYEYTVQVYNGEEFRYQIDVFNDLDSAEDYANNHEEDLEEGEFIVISEIEYEDGEELSCRIIESYE